ncbi:MAG: hypothetical protein OHK0012_13540 [Synechococcales cyanobacterium]
MTIKCRAFYYRQSKPENYEEFVYFRGSYKPYQELGELHDILGVYPCTDEEQDKIAIPKRDLFRQKHVVEVCIFYHVNEKLKQQKILCSQYNFSRTAELSGKPYRNGVIRIVRQQMRRVSVY